MKKKHRIAAVAGAGLLFACGISEAACTFDTPGRPGQIKTSFVRDFAACPSDEHPSGNNSTTGGITACSPIEPQANAGLVTPYEFSDTGGCTLSIKTKLLKDCSALTNAADMPLGLPADACYAQFWKAKCSGIVDALGEPLQSPDDAPLELRLSSRISLTDPMNGNITLIDVPVSMLFSDPDAGRMELEGSLNEALLTVMTTGDAALEPCTSVELLSAKIRDSDGRPFATMGTATPGL